MSKTIFFAIGVAAGVCFLAGCSGSKLVFPVSLKSDEVLAVRADIRAEQNLPVEVKTQEGKTLPVVADIKAEQSLPVDLTVKDEKGIPVRVQGQSDAEPMTVSISQDNALQVKGQNQDSRWFPVEMRITREAVIAVIVAGLAMLAAVVSCFLAWRSARGARLAAEARLFFELMERYAAKEMRNHLRTLYEWDRKEVGSDKSKRDEHAQKWVKQLFASGDENLRKEADEIDAARRCVTHYFLNVLLLNDAGYVSNCLVKKLCRGIGHGGTDVLNITLALEKALIESTGLRDGKSERQISKAVKDIERRFQKLMAITS